MINAAIVYFYASSFQGIDEEEFGGMWELTKEGFVTSFAGFLVSFMYREIFIVCPSIYLLLRYTW